MKGVSQIDTLEMVKRLDNAREVAISLKNTFARLTLETEFSARELKRFGVIWRDNQ